ncbi:hypothetical protein DENSPDRAFT_838955 [Dentipellis sp. KUC8613]|nr:hypothetical protein DENSPDRAFT_838955 [Dentipellis sp. KUC8613]
MTMHLPSSDYPQTQTQSPSQSQGQLHGQSFRPARDVVPERDNLSTRAVHGGSTPGTDTGLDTHSSAAGAGSDNSAYPPQRHAGKVGYGPHYGESGAGVGDKITGLKEQALGKVKKNPELVEHGRELRSGQLKRKEQAEQDAANNPFAEPGEKQDQGQERSRGQDADYERATVTAPAGTDKARRQVGEEHVDPAMII